MSLDVNAIAPTTPELEAVAARRCDAILKEWARLISVWGTTTLHGPEPYDPTFGLRALVIAAYVQGARDSIAVAVSMDRTGVTPAAEGETP